MRQIKFRAWSQSDKLMFYDGFYVNIKTGLLHYTMPESIEDQEDKVNFYDCGEEEPVLMQFTGLTDKNGKEIYDEDILRVFYNGKEYYCIVEWNQQMAGWCLRMSDPNRYLEINALAMDGDENGIVSTSTFVIGNIHEHPYLLK